MNPPSPASALGRWARGALPGGVRNVLVHRKLYTPAVRRSARRPTAIVYGNCQAEALRRILVTHEGFAQTYDVVRVPAVHEITAPQLSRLERLLRRADLLITQDIKTGYRGLALGTSEIIASLPADAVVLRYPVAFFEGLFPFQIYIQRGLDPIASPAPITDYHDLRHLYAARRGWTAEVAARWLDQLSIPPSWVSENAGRSVAELEAREADLDAKISGAVRSAPTTTFHTINHPTNELVVHVAGQLLAQLGHADSDSVLASHQTYLDTLKAPLEPQVVQALGGRDDGHLRQDWVTPRGTFDRRAVLSAHLDAFARDPQLLADGVAKHAERLAWLEASSS